MQSVLIIDDALTVHKVIEVRLRSEKLLLHHAYNAEEGLALLRRHRPDLVLLDLDMPDTNGMDVCRQIRADPALVATPVIFLTGTIDVSVKVQAFDLGAIDYVTKPFDSVELQARVRGALRTKQYYDMLAAKAQLDAITGLWNRAFFDARLTEEIAATLRHQRPLALVMVDVDHFKRFNDTFGHDAGDAVLRQLALTLRKCVRESDIVCRFGGEEFVVVLPEAHQTDGAVRAKTILETMRNSKMTHESRALGAVTVSIGLAMYPAHGTTTKTLLLAADKALYAAKGAGRDCVMLAV